MSSLMAWNCRTCLRNCLAVSMFAPDCLLSRETTSSINNHYSAQKRQQRTMKIYTKTGDKGTTALYTGERRAKFEPLFECLGSIDELSSALGLATVFAEDMPSDVVPDLIKVQSCLQDINSIVATPESSARKAHIDNLYFDEKWISELELKIDQMTEILPPLTNFILPSGGKTGATLHLARSICRRAERRLAHVTKEEGIDPRCLKYINRLSDYLFTLARYTAHLEGRAENIYTRHRSTSESEPS